MKEKIYTIPVNDAFDNDSECPMCSLEKKLEQEMVEYYLGPSLMEPDNRLETNENGFCRRHFEMLYTRQENTLGLALVIETHMELLLDKMRKMNPSAGTMKDYIKKKIGAKTAGNAARSRVSSFLSDINARCSICSRLNHTMNRYTEVIFYLWRTEEDFKKKLESCKGFCLRHLEHILDSAGTHLAPRQEEEFNNMLYALQLENMERVLEDVRWFTKKFDYRYKDAPWKNSRDAVPRSIEKITGYLRKR